MAHRRATSDIRFVRLSRNGHAEAVCIPLEFRAALQWFRGCQLEVWVEGDRLVLTKARSARAAVDPGPGVGETDPETGQRGVR